MTIVIKRYQNRKLYNTQSKQYVTLGEIKEFIENHFNVKVVDNSTGNDITATTLSQIILETGKNQNDYLPINLLIGLVRSGGKHLETLLQNISPSLDGNARFVSELERRMNLIIARGELDQNSGKEILEKLILLHDPQELDGDNLEDGFVEFLRNRQLSSKKDVQELIYRIDRLSKKIDDINDDSAKS